MKTLQILWISWLAAWTAAGGVETAQSQPRPLPEGLELRQVEGTARLHEKTKAWRFSPHKILTARRLTISPQTELTILPSSALEKILSYAGTQTQVDIRVDAVVTQYQNSNFLFIFDAAPLKGTSENETQPDKTKLDETQIKNVLRTAVDPNESSVIPPDILRRMKPSQKTDFARMAQKTPSDIREDTMLVSRTGRFIRLGPAGEFVLDGFGRNLSGQSFILLPCKTLEQVEQQNKQSLERPRYRVSGILTSFHGRTFLLLQGAARTYTHGNFTP
jgi:hypothetical protein